MHREIKDNIYWTGAIDWKAREFHGYQTRFGTTYNSYVIKDEKNALIDTVKEGFESQLLERLEHAGIDDLDYIIVNHIEMDHAGSLEKVLEEYPDVQIVTNKRAKKGLVDAYGMDVEDVKIVETGDELTLGEKTLTFLKTTMVHWPDSMVTYAVEDNVLFSNDAFGLHFASKKRFDDEFDDQEMGKIFNEAAKYYANIVLPYGRQVQGVLDQVEELGLEFDIIAPSHGIIWRENIPEILERYDAWSSNEDQEKVIILYDSMWHHTEEAAFTIAKGVEEKDVDYRVYNLSDSDWTEIMAEVMISKGLIVGSPTLNGEIYPAVAGFLTYMKGLNPVDKITAAFGSYGWSGEAVGKITDIFEELDYEIVDTHKWIFDADQEELSSLKTLGENVAEEVIDSD